MRKPLPVLDVVVTVNLYEYWTSEIAPSIQRNWKPTPGSGFRVRIDLVDTTQEEAAEKDDD